MPVVLPLPAVAVQAVQPGNGPNPEDTLPFLKHRRHDVATQAVRVIGSMAIVLKPSRAWNEFVDTTKAGANPEHAGSIQVEGQDAAAAEAVRVVGVMLIVRVASNWMPAAEKTIYPE